MKPILVWDLPVRLFHWSLAAAFTVAYLTGESERYRDIHIVCGYLVGGLIVFRLLWGLVGTRHARFAAFVRGPAAVYRYLGSLLSGHPEHHTGHNPAGALAILALLALGLATPLAGWLTYQEIGGEGIEEVHEVLAGLMLALVAIHLAGVAVSSWLHRENLARAMVTGHKQGEAVEAASGARPLVALLLLLGMLALGAWAWNDVSAASLLPGSGVVEKHGHHHEDDD
jgi:cytochrome b